MSILDIELEELEELAKKAEPLSKKLFTLLKKKKPRELDDIVHDMHDEMFEKVDCLECGRCCKSLGPVIKDRDVDRMAKYLKLKPAKFIQEYLRLDEDGDYVFKSMPCPFLMPDNYCMVYENRPKACSEYPHTDRKRFYQILDLTLKNTFTCPVVYKITENLKEIYRKPS